jgi:hypothetical protein
VIISNPHKRKGKKEKGKRKKRKKDIRDELQAKTTHLYPCQCNLESEKDQSDEAVSVLRQPEVEADVEDALMLLQKKDRVQLHPNIT